jgi:ADP-ribose pyrophosphatase YjhB (NUDIX family)
MNTHRNSKPFTPEEFKDIYSKVTRVTVDLIVKTPEGVVLALRTHYAWKGFWHFPGGTILYQESVLEAVERIARDEIGVAVQVQKFLGYIEARDEQQHRGFGSTVSLEFLCTTDTVEFATNEDASRVELFKEIPDNLIPEQADFLREHWDEIQTI